MTNHILIEKTEQCCACGACVNTCPRNAIQMKEDAAGFLFPSVDESLCVNCGLCVKVCTFTEKGAGAHGEPEVFAAALKDQDVLRESSSGGVFSALANAVLDRGGVVFGAAWTEDLALKHIAVENKADLQKLRGSKYAQSSTGTTFRDVKKILAEGRTVLYSGTPCQIAGLKAYLGTDPENLLTADLVCHGVPSQRMLRDDLQHVSRKGLRYPGPPLPRQAVRLGDQGFVQTGKQKSEIQRRHLSLLLLLPEGRGVPGKLLPLPFPV